MKTKITYVSSLTTAIENPSALSAEEREKLVALRESLIKRNATKSNAPTKVQKQNAEIGEAVLASMEMGVTYSNADICALVPALAEASSQKVSPIMRKLVESGAVVKSVVKGKNFYTLA